jgi:ATP-binding cassette subfamily F protein 3
VEPRARIAILGANGQGKSTILKLLKGELTPQSGKRVARPSVRVAHFAQYHVDMLELDETALEFFRRTKTSPDGSTPSDLEIRTHLGLFSVSGDQPLRPMNTLSGGQRSRVCFASMMFEAPHVFLVDEGSHHLDVATLDALGQALRRFDGAVVLVSHDIYLVRDVCERGFPEDDAAARVVTRAASGSGAGGIITPSQALGDEEQAADNIGSRPEFIVVDGGTVRKVAGLDEYLGSIKPEI